MTYCVFCLTEPRICSAGRSPTTIARGNGEDSVTPIDAGGAYPFSTATRHRKKSYSANPSVVALRETLKISGGTLLSSFLTE